MKTTNRLFVLIALVGAAIRLALPAAQAAQSKETALILPCASFGIGNALPYGPLGANAGYNLVANGISAYWATGTQTLDLVIFVFAGESSVTQTITLTVTSPTGAKVYSDAWTDRKLGYQGNYYFSYAKANYSVPGIYTAAVSADGTQIGETAIAFTPSH